MHYKQFSLDSWQPEGVGEFLVMVRIFNQVHIWFLEINFVWEV